MAMAREPLGTETRRASPPAARVGSRVASRRSRASGPRRTGAIHDTQDRYSIPTSSKHAIFISLNELTGTVNGPREVDNVPDNCTDSDTETDPSPVRPTGTPGIRDPGSGGARALGFVCDTRFIK